MATMSISGTSGPGELQGFKKRSVEHHGHRDLYLVALEFEWSAVGGMPRMRRKVHAAPAPLPASARSSSRCLVGKDVWLAGTYMVSVRYIQYLP